MISLSRIIKVANYRPSEDSVLLSVTPVPPKTESDPERLQKNLQIFQEAEIEAKTILADAEETAQTILRQAIEEAEQLKQEASLEIQRWWEQKQQEAAQLFSSTQEQATAEGHEKGFAEGKQQAYEEETQALAEARAILEQAYSSKQQIIAEAEPFLVELALEIAKKIIGQELQQNPEQVLEIAKKALRRSRVHGEITICVNHNYFHYVSEHRPQLLALLEGQAELSIYPDYTIADGGCVIRTQLGSVDARVDTQLEEIKQALLAIAGGSESR
ncbi:flagellar assembly protein FliH [Brevibacillus agri]|uniref:flagellar assembly protein FliH n=1 Tax=Brevibacillus agri TaxID=51101 RepID=UPI000471F12D|nr:flagellar assembly protein FliH [Brevibacillus agri]MCG5250710.1 flagellar assembly protein FliH [Brevibacillus agri]MED1646539.1 flagellar assembly protein FliH [Brevibacillus agri]MED1656881.1 flagellar assembly protein FliH [Brevibacillus agri]MED1686914.1 flagellar assembly protein FliH [Brevibacillus agri]MED1690641.1 flagellar assembly protein FliH [Brevibacillus agri]